MTDRIKAVIWDMGGVLVRSEDNSPRSLLGKEYNFSLQEIHNFVFNGDSARRATLGEINAETHWRNLGKQLGIDEEKLREFQNRFWEGDRLDQGLVNFIRKLKESYTTGLLSNAWSGTRQDLTLNKPCIDAFDVSVFSYEIGLAKPDPTIYRYILKLCHVEPEEAVFVDDMVENIEAANRLGIHGVQFINSSLAIQEVKALLNHNG